MISRVLIADDSLTIQKVISITLANSGYELVECVSEEELFRKIQSNHFDLILLDFNLSDSRSGYELAKQINSIMPGVAIIVMLGTFDTVDESQFSACGIADKIVKPFESSKFIKKCAELLEGIRSVPPKAADKKPTNVVVQNAQKDNLDSWKLDNRALSLKEDSSTSSNETMVGSPEDLDPLSSEMKGWGFKAENELEETFHKSFPPVIRDLSQDEVIEKFISSSGFIREEQQEDETKNEIVLDDNETNPTFKVPEGLNRNLLTEIDDEASAESFWAVDELAPIQAEEANDILKTNLDDVTEDLTETVQTYKASQPSMEEDEDEDEAVIHMDQEELIEKLKMSLKPMIEEMVREFCRQNAEKVAWEVIPDLAENLIKKEIKEISDSIPH